MGYSMAGVIVLALFKSIFVLLAMFFGMWSVICVLVALFDVGGNRGNAFVGIFITALTSFIFFGLFDITIIPDITTMPDITTIPDISIMPRLHP